MRLAFIVPLYGEKILGGAEGITRSFAEHLPRSEFSVDVLTTCASDYVTWRNVYPPGLSQVNSVPVYRFPIAHIYHIFLIKYPIK